MTARIYIGLKIVCEPGLKLIFGTRTKNICRQAVLMIFMTAFFQIEVVKAVRIFSDEENLFKRLFRSYNPLARPVINSSQSVNVSIQFSLLHIKELDVRSQVLTTTGLLILQWVDERLVWNPSDFGNLKELIVEARGLWRPEFAVINGAEKIYDDYNDFRAIIRYDGVIRWEPGGVFKTMCQIDITYYPFDDQSCDMIFGAWSYHTSKMNLTCPNDVINSDSYKTNGEWEIMRTHAKRHEFFYECCPNEKFSNVRFEILMKRRHTFYIMNVILPSILTSVLLLSIFFCTPGQKVQIGVVVLLSFRIFLLNVADNIPKTSDHIPLLGIYLTCTMAITTLSMVLTVFVLNLHHITDRPVPRWVHVAIVVYLAPVLGICIVDNDKRYFKSRTPKGHSRRLKSLRRASVRIDSDGDDASTMIELLPTTSQEQTHNGINDSCSNMVEAVYINDKTSISHVRIINDEDEDPDPDYAKEWKNVAEVFDRLFFFLFLLAIVISTLVLFHPLSRNYMKPVPPSE